MQSRTQRRNTCLHLHKISHIYFGTPPCLEVFRCRVLKEHLNNQLINEVKGVKHKIRPTKTVAGVCEWFIQQLPSWKAANYAYKQQHYPFKKKGNKHYNIIAINSSVWPSSRPSNYLPLKITCNWLSVPLHFLLFIVSLYRNAALHFFPLLFPHCRVIAFSIHP